MSSSKQPRRIAEQGPDDAVVQHHPRTPRNIDVDHAHVVPDNDWELGTEAEQIEAEPSWRGVEPRRRRGLQPPRGRGVEPE